MDRDTTNSGADLLVGLNREDEESSYKKSSLQLGVVPEGQQPRKPLDSAFNKIEANIAASSEAEVSKIAASAKPAKEKLQKKNNTKKKSNSKKKSSNISSKSKVVASEKAKSGTRSQSKASQANSVNEEYDIDSLFSEQKKLLDAFWSIYESGSKSADKIAQKYNKASRKFLDDSFDAASKAGDESDIDDPIDIFQKQINTSAETFEKSLKLFEETCAEISELQMKVSKIQEKLG